MKKIRSDLENIKPYVPGKPISEVKRELGLVEVVKLASNESPYPPFPGIISALEKELKVVNRYPDSGCYALKKRLAQFLGVDEGNLMIGHGSNELIRLLANVLLEPGDEAIMATPSFIVYPTVVKISRGVCIEVPLDSNDKHDLSSMLDKVSDKTRLVFIANPNNPTGTIVEKDEAEEFLEKLPADVFVVFDEAYFEYVESGNFPQSINYFKKGKNIAVLRTFSKIYSLAGLRIGYGIAPEDIIEAVDKVREPFNVNSLAQAAALAGLSRQDEVKKRKEITLEGKRYFYKEFERLGLKYIPSEANFVMVDVKEDSKVFFKKLLRLGVIVRTGDIFGERYINYIRVSIGKPEENQKFIGALEKILKNQD